MRGHRGHQRRRRSFTLTPMQRVFAAAAIGRCLATELNINPMMLAWFAFLHDSQRHNDYLDPLQAGTQPIFRARRRTRRPRVRVALRGNASSQRWAQHARGRDPRLLGRGSPRPRECRHRASTGSPLHRRSACAECHCRSHAVDATGPGRPFALRSATSLAAPEKLKPCAVKLLSRHFFESYRGALYRFGIASKLFVSTPSATVLR